MMPFSFFLILSRARSARVEGRTMLTSFPTPPQGFIVAANQRFFLRPPPAFELTLGRDGIGDAVEFLVEDELHRAARRRIAAKAALVVLGNAPLQRVARRPDIVGSVAAEQDVDVGAHLRCIIIRASFDRRATRASSG